MAGSIHRAALRVDTAERQLQVAARLRGELGEVQGRLRGCQMYLGGAQGPTPVGAPLGRPSLPGMAPAQPY